MSLLLQGRLKLAQLLNLRECHTLDVLGIAADFRVGRLERHIAFAARFDRELELQVEVVHRVAREVQAASKQRFPYMVGTMIEIPRGAINAGTIAKTAEFFSFGTNDLTQTCLGMSRDDSGSFLPRYAELEIAKDNPFATIDVGGVGELVRMAVERGRAARPDIKLGICGEHGGDPTSVVFFHDVGLQYVSCSPFRVPVARLAAARAAVLEADRLKKAAKSKR